jgi:alginate O-acetyltransferase complex protein AlgI
MLFNSFEYALFLPIVFLLYWFVTNRSLQLQNILLLLASYFFYGWWDYRFLFLLMFSTFLDFYTGIRIFEARSRSYKLLWLWISITVNVGFLALFKYYNFFITSFADGLSLMGVNTNVWTLKVILPVGISFYTFHGLSYIFDIFNKRIQPQRNFINYSVFVSFFPLLVAGPIERATHLLPQIIKKREFDYTKAIDGLRQILWGLFKKIVIADNCATYANEAFNNYHDYSGFTLVIGAVFFAFQIYCDFSGYSDIALGTARLFGIELLRNFAFPYFSRDIAEFWRRWHISLTTWFRDYLYIPLGGSKGGTWMKIRNTFIIFLVSGFWHGANWTFIVWGALNALYFIPLMLMKTNRNNLDIVAQGRFFPSLREFSQIVITFLLTLLAWVFFRANTVSDALEIIKRILTSSHHISILELRSLANSFWVTTSHVLLLCMFIVIEWLQRDKQHALQIDHIKIPKLMRWGYYYFLVFLIFYFSGTQQDFIYFQF